MAWYLYILKSKTDGDFYKGISEDVYRRLQEHNDGLSQFTSSKGPWEIICILETESKKQAIIEERRIKKLNRKSLDRIINSDKNILNS